MRRKSGNDYHKDLFLSENESFIEESQLASASVLVKVYNMFGFELLQNPQSDILKLLEECTFKFIGSNRVMREPGGVAEQRQLLS